MLQRIPNKMANLHHEFEEKATQMEKQEDDDISPVGKGISAENDPHIAADVKLQPAGLISLTAIKDTWNIKSLAWLWGGAIALSFVVAYNQTTSSSFAPYATSDFGQLALLGTIGTIQNVIAAGRCYSLYLHVL